MARTYQVVMSTRRGTQSVSMQNDRDVFAHAYDIAMQVIDLREHRGLSQAELAKKSGIEPGDLSQIERGSASPTTQTLHQIAEALDADVRLVPRAELSG